MSIVGMALSATNTFHYMKGGLNWRGENNFPHCLSQWFLMCAAGFYFYFYFVLPEGDHPREDSFSFPETSFLKESHLPRRLGRLIPFIGFFCCI